MKEMFNNTLFVTGTSTSVGKTYLCTRLLEFLQMKGVRAGYQKWVATGTEGGLPADTVFCLAAAGISPTAAHVRLHTSYCFRFPASPHLAAAMEGRVVEPEVIIENYRSLAAAYEWLIVEGAGGIMVPLRRDLLLVDLLARLRPATLVVAASGLGTLNHTLLTLEALRHRQIPVLGVVFSDGALQEDERLVHDNMQTVEEIGGVRVFGRLRRLDAVGGRSAFVPVGQAIWEQMIHGAAEKNRVL